MRKVLKIIALILFVAILGLQLMRPDRTNPHVNESETLEASTKIPKNIQAILKRSCGDCHSNETSYPWYSNIAPISWSVADHVRVGRGKMNFSVWNTYGDSKKSRKFKEICHEIESGSMPHNQYLWLHWDAKLTGAEVKKLCRWAEKERAKLKSG